VLIKTVWIEEVAAAGDQGEAEGQARVTGLVALGFDKICKNGMGRIHERTDLWMSKGKFMDTECKMCKFSFKC
jgi:hypothetical protein